MWWSVTVWLIFKGIWALSDGDWCLFGLSWESFLFLFFYIIKLSIISSSLKQVVLYISNMNLT
jgi:hypothetical protein